MLFRFTQKIIKNISKYEGSYPFLEVPIHCRSLVKDFYDLI